MAFLLMPLLLQTGVVLGSNYGYVEWSDNDRDAEIRAKGPTPSSPQNINGEPLHHRPTHSAVVAHKIEEELPRVVTAFLHTGDSAALRQVNCSRRYELSSLRGGVQAASHYSLHGVLDTMTHAANFLNVILQGNRSRERTLRGDIHWYHALVRSILEGDPKIRRAVVTFHTDAPTPGPHVFLQATRTEKEVVLQDLSNSVHHHHHHHQHHHPKSSRSVESEWLDEFGDRRRRPYLQRRAPSGPESVVTESGGYFLDKKQIKWSAPYLECEHGTFVPHWLLTLSAGFYGLRANSAPEFRGVVRVDVNLQDVDIDQCSESGWFAGTHRCNLTSMECTPIGGHGFVLDKYKCQCRRGFYHPSRVALNGLTSKEQGSYRDDSSEVSSKCLPCREGCPYCRDDTPCLVQEDGALRLAVATFQGLCMVLDLASMVVVYHFRRNKKIRTSGLILVEAILTGALLLYFPVMILYFHPSVFRCILLRWVRLLGFAIMYGTIILKLYRVLKVFLSRTAQRTPYMTSWRVLRLLGVILLVVLWFLVAWTSAVCQRPELTRALITAGLTPEGLQFSICLLDRWDYMMAVAEFLFLLWGVYLCYAVRTVPSAFHEPRYIAVAIYNELLISAIFHIIRFSLAPGLHPDWMLMLFFAHTHLTVTVTLGLLLIPKFVSKGTQARDDIATEAYEEELDMGRSGSYLNNSITSAWSEHSLDPEDIRDELKKLYAQLEVHKRKKMLANNPHLQKKRSSKKGLGRSLMRRITEIPESIHMHRQCSREDGSEHGSSRSTLRRNPFDPTHHGKTRDDSLKNKVLGLKKSLSYDHACDQGEETRSHDGSTAGDKLTPAGSIGEGSLLGSLIGRKHAKKSPEQAATPPRMEPAESTESVPLFWKSASAHNLTHEKKPVHLRTSIMQKSLSVIASAKEKMPGLTNKTHSVEDASKKGLKRRDGRMLSEVDETPEHYPKMIISQSVEISKTPLKMGIMKQQVSGSQPTICSESGRNLYDLSEVCTWELDDPPTPSEGKSQKHVSIAPGETTAVRRGSSSGSTKGSRSQQKQRTGQSPANRRRSKDKGGEKDESRESRKPRSPRSPLPVKPDVCPWDFEEQPMLGGNSDSISPDRIRRKKSVTPTDGKPKTLHSDHSKSTGSLLQPPSLMVEICPWDYHTPPSPKQEKTCNSPTSHSKRKRKGSCSSNHRPEKGKDREKSKERRSSSSKPSSERRRVSQSSDSGGPTSERRRSSTREPETTEKKRAEICPWETESSSASIVQTKTSPERKRENSLSTNYKPLVTSSAKMADVCPWDFEDKDSGKNV
ncbi:probable G-protein coupled receptor 158 [Lampris incognitus]|uniref:probable G-protein coupled receptor 158 n=1 Tax=Lampris incognitus TaxID=2546036 RepID=UPI0024B4AA48|nr:probable G-protein coupled receptor 158 [Lampris incognitus]